MLASQILEITVKVRHGLEGLHPIPSRKPTYTWREDEPCAKHAYVLWATAIRTMLDWSVNFHQFLEHRVNADISCYSSRTSIRKGWWLNGWLKQWPKEKNQLIHEGIATYLHDNFSWEDTQSKRDIHHALRVNKMAPSFPAFANSFMWVRESFALQLLNVRSELVRQLVQAGLIRANVKTLSHKDPLIAREDVLKIHERWAKGIPLDDAEPALHISKELATYLVEAGILETVHSDEQNNSEYLLDKVALSNLLDSLYYKTSRRYLANASFYSLTEAVNILKPMGYDEPKLLQTALENRIPAILWRGNTLGDVLFQ